MNLSCPALPMVLVVFGRHVVARNISEIESDIKVLKDEVLVIDREYKELEDRLAWIKLRRRQIVGSFYVHGDGELARLNSELDDAKLLEEHKSLPRVVWSSEGFGGDWVITRVTPKRIYVSELGDSREIHFDKVTGERPGGWYSHKLDVPACLEAFEGVTLE